MSLPTGKKLFVERVEFALIEHMNALTGIRRLLDPDKGSQLQMLFGGHIDVKPETKQLLDKHKKDIENALVPLFWDEMIDPSVRLIEVKARLIIGGLPRGVSESATNTFSEDDIDSLAVAPFRIDGMQRGIFDDVAVFDVPSWMVDQSTGFLDLTRIERFLSLGSTITFFFPAPQHQRWYTYAKRHALPPSIRCTKKLSVVFNKALSPDVTSIVFGVDKSDSPKSV
jgi:hypothetical protein